MSKSPEVPSKEDKIIDLDVLTQLEDELSRLQNTSRWKQSSYAQKMKLFSESFTADTKNYLLHISISRKVALNFLEENCPPIRQGEVYGAGTR